MAETKTNHVLVVVAPYYTDIIDNLLAGCRAELEASGAEITVREVPGALELPIAIRIAADEGAYDGYVALGCVMRGQTTHYETVSNESARGLMELGLRHGLAIGNGILTVEDEAQAILRADPAQKNKGGEAAKAAMALMALRNGSHASATGTSERKPTFLPDSEHIIVAGSGGTAA